MNPQTILWVESALVLMLIGGAVLARFRRFRLHGWVQGAVVAANAVVIGAAMIPSFHRQWISPDDSPRVVTLHAISGTIAELLAIYIVLSAAGGWLPARFRVTQYKPWMRTALALWLAAFGLGAATYQTLNGEAPGASQISAQSARIVIRNFEFAPRELAVSAGTEVEWIDEGGRHTIQVDDGSFQSDTMIANGSFRHRFDRPGVYRYFCSFHGAAGGHDMAGVVIVR